MTKLKAHQVTREVFEAACFEHFCRPAITITAADRELLRLVDSEGGIKNANGSVVFPPCPIGHRDWKRLMKAELVESRGFGFRVTVGGSVQCMMFDGINPWMGGPIKSHERLVSEALAAGHDVPNEVLAEYPELTK